MRPSTAISMLTKPSEVIFGAISDANRRAPSGMAAAGKGVVKSFIAVAFLTDLP